ncbi:hypothetical protein DD581_34540 [Klebsiella pneumoniae]|nr:hypothetical protein DD581_34540 [Klebsiella pneumoniae]
MKLDVANASLEYSEQRINDQEIFLRQIRENPAVASIKGIDEVYKALEKKNNDLKLELKLEQS